MRSKFQFPGLKILDRYILRKFLSTYFFAIGMIIIIVVIFDYAEKIDNFTASHAPFHAIIFDYYLHFIPSFINQFSGLFAFIAVIFFTSKMAYQTEIVAMLSGGMSFKRLMWPYFVGAMTIGALSLVMNLWIIPKSQEKQIAFEVKYVNSRKKANAMYDQHIYRQITPGVFVYLRAFSGTTHEASFFALEQYDGSSIKSSLEASNIKYNEETQRWSALQYTKRDFDSLGVETFTQHRNLDTLLNLDINELGRINGLIATMDIHELNAFHKQQKIKGADSIDTIEVAKQVRYAYPVAVLILTLIGVSLSSRKVRGGTGLHIGIGIGLCFSYILFARIFEEFAKGGAIDPSLATWIPNILYLIIGVYLYIKAPK